MREVSEGTNEYSEVCIQNGLLVKNIQVKIKRADGRVAEPDSAGPHSARRPVNCVFSYMVKIQ